MAQSDSNEDLMNKSNSAKKTKPSMDNNNAASDFSR